MQTLDASECLFNAQQAGLTMSRNRRTPCGIFQLCTAWRARYATHATLDPERLVQG